MRSSRERKSVTFRENDDSYDDDSDDDVQNPKISPREILVKNYRHLQSFVELNERTFALPLLAVFQHTVAWLCATCSLNCPKRLLKSEYGHGNLF